jgi:CRISPR/Cas system-associated endonuclease/helicase Cas3
LDLTQEKIIQAMGRIGRNNIQQDYTLRFRDDGQIMKLFTNETEKPEIVNMNRLFNSANVVWNGVSYEEYPEQETQEEEQSEDEYTSESEAEEEQD